MRPPVHTRNTNLRATLVCHPTSPPNFLPTNLRHFARGYLISFRLRLVGLFFFAAVCKTWHCMGGETLCGRLACWILLTVGQYKSQKMGCMSHNHRRTQRTRSKPWHSTNSTRNGASADATTTGRQRQRPSDRANRAKGAKGAKRRDSRTVVATRTAPTQSGER